MHTQFINDGSTAFPINGRFFKPILISIVMLALNGIYGETHAV